MTIVEQILQAWINAISAADIGASVFREHTESLGSDELPAVNLKPMTEGTRTLGSGIKANTLDIEVDVHVKDSPPSGRADPIVEAMHKVVMADVGLKGLVAEISYTGREWEQNQGDEQRGKITVRYSITYSVPSGRL